MFLKGVIVDKNFKDLKLLETITKQSFPQEEYVAPEIIIKMAEKDKNIFYLALYDNENLVGYVVVKLYKMYCYLFFLAISPDYRSNGYGSKAIDFIKNQFKDYKHIVDFEMVDETAENNEERIKRRNFYIKNGYKPTGMFLKYLNLSFEIFTMNDDFDLEIYKDLMNTIKIDGYSNLDFKYFSIKN